MKKEDVIAIFDIGKTNKKFFLFNQNLNVVFKTEKIFPTILDEDGFVCDDFQNIEKWMNYQLEETLQNKRFQLLALNFSAYGSTMVYLNNDGKKTAPVYNYLKRSSSPVQHKIYRKYGGKEEFCRVTASPDLGFENCGHQLLWFRKYKSLFFVQTQSALFLAQYLGYRFHKKLCSELTSIGCHTAMWNHDENTLHKWTKDEKLDKLLPDILPTNQVFESKVFGKSIKVGIGVHDSSASVTPYLFWAKEPFVLISTGTWCINMNPSNQNKLTVHELKNKCINYFSAFGKTIKSSRFFLGHIFNLNTKKIAEIYGTDAQSYKSIKYNESIIKKLLINNEVQFLFFKDGIPENYTSTLEPTGIFDCFEEAYHQLVLELVFINHKLLRLITNDGPKIKDVYISGGFAENPLFARLTATLLPEKNVYVSRISNASALGAALLVYKVFEKTMPAISLKRKKIKPFSFKIED